MTEPKPTYHTINTQPGDVVQINVAGRPYLLELCIPELSDDEPVTLHPIEPLAQRDPRWANILLGHSDTHTIGQWGCALTCASMVLRQYDPALTPDELQRRIINNGGFWNAFINWQAIANVFPWANYDGMTNWEQIPADIDAIVQFLDECGPAILWVDFHPETGRHESHFVLAINDDTRDGIQVADPWLGRIVDLTEAYGLDGMWSDARAVYGLRRLWVDTKPPNTATYSLPAEPDWDTVTPSEPPA